jgi:recombination protein RecA
MSKKNKAIAGALAALEKRYGEPVVQKMSNSNNNIKTFSSGRPQLDSILGGGFAVGKPVEIYAEEACGKTGLALNAIKTVQQNGGIAAIVDTEHALNTAYCEEIGVDVEALYISQPDTAEQAFEVIRSLISTGEVDLIVIDSVAAMIPRAELEGESGQANMALLARIMSQGMKMVTGIAATAECTLIFLNQLRDTLAMYGTPKKPAGGNALKFYAAQRLEIKNRGQIKDGSGQDAKVIGFKQQIKVTKNKVAPPFKVIQEDIIYGKGVDEITGIIEACVFEGILEKKGAFFKYNDSTIAQGMAKLRALLESDPDLVEELKAELASTK